MLNCENVFIKDYICKKDFVMEMKCKIKYNVIYVIKKNEFYMKINLFLKKIPIRGD